MNILLGTFRFFSLTGTETFTYTIARQLSRLGHKIYLYSPFIGGKIFKKSKKLSIFISGNLADFKNEKIDLIHVQHNLTSILLRYAFPQIPSIYLIHGPTPYLEQMPSFLDFNYYGAISGELVEHLSTSGKDPKKIFLFPNSVDTKRFSPESTISKWPKKLLVMSNYFHKDGQHVFKKAAKKLNLEIKFIGGKKQIWSVEKEINKADVVASLGRGAIEAMSCGRSVLIFNYSGGIYKNGDGLLKKSNIPLIAKTNFSGRAIKIPFTEKNVKRELLKYDQTDGSINRECVQKNHSISKNIKILLSFYKKASLEKPASFNKKQLDFSAKGLNEMLSYEKLIYRYRDFKSLLFTRFKDQIMPR